VSQIARERLAGALILAREGIAATGSLQRRSTRRFEAIGRAYVLFAVGDPNLFDAAFVACDVRPAEEDDPSAWAVLVDSVDEMVGTGAIPPARRKDAPLIAWSGVHGLATILTASIWPAGHTFDDEVGAVVAGILRAIV
jgi:hypothetical protein